MSQSIEVVTIPVAQLEALVIKAVRTAMPEPRVERRLLSPRDVEEEYGIKERLLAAWRAQGLGPKWTTVGRHIFYERDVLEAYISAGRVNTAG